MIQVANAPCSWGVIENTEGERKTYLDVINEMSAAGYAGNRAGRLGLYADRSQRFNPRTDITQLADAGIMGHGTTLR